MHRLLRVYRATVYRVDSATIRIGRRAPAADAVLRALNTSTACLIGADNPGSRRMPDGWNLRARARLATTLRRVLSRPATGAWRAWSEAHVLAALPATRARILARRFRQNAIVVLRQGAPARLIWTPGLRMATSQSGRRDRCADSPGTRPDGVWPRRLWRGTDIPRSRLTFGETEPALTKEPSGQLEI